MTNNGCYHRLLSAEALFVACERGIISVLVCCGGRFL